MSVSHFKAFVARCKILKKIFLFKFCLMWSIYQIYYCLKIRIIFVELEKLALTTKKYIFTTKTIQNFITLIYYWLNGRENGITKRDAIKWNTFQIFLEKKVFKKNFTFFNLFTQKEFNWRIHFMLSVEKECIKPPHLR